MVKCDDLTHILFIVHYALESLGAFFFGPFYHDNYRKSPNFMIIYSLWLKSLPGIFQKALNRGLAGFVKQKGDSFHTTPPR